MGLWGDVSNSFLWGPLELAFLQSPHNPPAPTPPPNPVWLVQAFFSPLPGLVVLSLGEKVGGVFVVSFGNPMLQNGDLRLAAFGGVGLELGGLEVFWGKVPIYALHKQPRVQIPKPPIQPPIQGYLTH